MMSISLKLIEHAALTHDICEQDIPSQLCADTNGSKVLLGMKKVAARQVCHNWAQA